jgi:hypothetical protein
VFVGDLGGCKKHKAFFQEDQRGGEILKAVVNVQRLQMSKGKQAAGRQTRSLEAPCWVEKGGRNEEQAETRENQQVQVLT